MTYRTSIKTLQTFARVAELVDAGDLKSSGLRAVRVRLPAWALLRFGGRQRISVCVT